MLDTVGCRLFPQYCREGISNAQGTLLFRTFPIPEQMGQLSFENYSSCERVHSACRCLNLPCCFCNKLHLFPQVRSEFWLNLRLTMSLFKDSNLAYKAALMYCFSPASIHYSAMYCDGLFGCLTTIALYELYKNEDIFDKMAIFKSCFWFGLACCTRANGIFNLFFLGYRLLQILVKILIEERSRIVNIFWRLVPYICLALLAVFSCTASYVIHQLYQASIYCWDLYHKYGPGYPAPEYCHTGWWNGYSYLQLEYFGVKPLGYWSWRNLPPIWRNFPIYIIYGLFIIKIFYYQSYNTIFMGVPSLLEEEKKVYRNNFLKSPKVIPFMWVSLVNMIAIGVNSHVVVSVRLLGQSPLLYWYMAYYTSSGSPGEKGIVPEFSLKRHWMVLYCMWRYIQGGIIFGGEVAWY
jgi:GPI mannosyltransferase 2